MGSRVISMLSAAGTAHSNSTDEAILTSVAIPGGTFANGKLVRITGAVRATATNSTDTLTVKLYHHTAATVLSGTACGTSGAVDVANDDVVNLDVILSPRSAAGSTSGTIVVHGFMSAAGAEGTVTARAVHQILSSIDFTATQYFGLGGDWSAASSSDSCQAEAFDVVEHW